MTSRIWIGGPLRREVSHELVLAVRRASVSTGLAGLEHIVCKPRSIEGLMEALSPDRHLHLQGEPHRILPLVETCRDLGLAYRYWEGGTLEAGGDIDVPVRLQAPRPDLPLVEHHEVRRAMALLRAGEILGALLVLERTCPEVPELPPLRLLET